MNPKPVPRPSVYLGADRSGADFWLAGPHVFSVSADGSRSRRVCALARFNRRSGCQRRGRHRMQRAHT